MARRRRPDRAPLDVWPVIADLFLTLIAVVVVMASGREPADDGVEQFKKEITSLPDGQFTGVVESTEVQTKWARLVFSETSLSFPKCEWDLPADQQVQMQRLFKWLGARRELLRQMRIEGHADRKWEGLGCKNVAPFLDNLQLSQNRARAVYNVMLGLRPTDSIGLATMLAGDLSVPLEHDLDYLRDLARRGCLEVAGYGDRHPRELADPDSPKNRRVELVLEFRERVSRTPSNTVVAANICETVR